MEAPQNKQEKFFREFEKLYRTGPNHLEPDTYYIKNGSRFVSLMRKWNNVPTQHHIMIRLDKKTGDIFTPSGKVPIGNINSAYGGLETFDKSGPIYKTHNERTEARIRELNGLPPVEKVTPPRDTSYFGL